MRIKIANPLIDSNEIEAVKAVLESGVLSQSINVRRFEEAFASYIGTDFAIATNSGTAALHTALLACGISEGDEVITTPFSFVATANAILYCRARPVFADIDERTFNIEPNSVEMKVTPKTRAILVVHLYGQPCNLEEILDICNRYNLVLIEDACQAHGAEYQGQKVGSFGVGCFSFYPTKNMTTGEGGMLTTNRKDIAVKANSIRNHGQVAKYVHEEIGYNYRMTEIAAAIGLCQLRRLDEFNSKRIYNASFLIDRIGQVKGINLPFIASESKHVFHQFTIKVTEDFCISRDMLQRKLAERGIDSAIHYETPIPKQPLYKKLGYDKCPPVAETVASQVLSLPVHPGLTKDDLEYLVSSIINVGRI